MKKDRDVKKKAKKDNSEKNSKMKEVLSSRNYYLYKFDIEKYTDTIIIIAKLNN